MLPRSLLFFSSVTLGQSVIVLPLWVAANGGVEDWDGEDEIVLHMDNGDCSVDTATVKVVEGRGVGFPDPPTIHIGDNHGVDIKLEERDTFINDVSNTQRLSADLLEDIDAFLQDNETIEQDIWFVPLKLSFAIQGGLKGALERLPVSGLFCVSPFDVVALPSFAPAAKQAARAFRLFRAASKVVTVLEVCAEDVAGLVSSPAQYSAFVVVGIPQPHLKDKCNDPDGRGQGGSWTSSWFGGGDETDSAAGVARLLGPLVAGAIATVLGQVV